MDPQSQLTLAWVLIGAGFLFMAAEMFIPSGGILSVLSALGIIGGVVLMFFYDVNLGLWTMLGVCITAPIVLTGLFQIWRNTPLGRRFFLTAPDEDATMSSMPVNLELEALRGQFGQALSTLRPAGVVDFGGRRVDSITEGIMVEKGQWVRCIDVKAGRVLVRPAERPNLTDLETAEFS